MEKRKVCFYGSLRRGHYNHERFVKYYPDGFNYLGTTTISGYNLFDLGSYPGIKVSQDPDSKVVVDLFELSEECFQSIEDMEHGAGYSTIKVTDDNTGEKYFCYLYEYPCSNLVESGDWSEHLELV